MPLYEYRCANGHISEHLRPLDMRNDAAECKTCHGPAQRAGVERCFFELVDDAFQTSGWTKPGWSGVDYQSGNAPDGIKRRPIHDWERGQARGD